MITRLVLLPGMHGTAELFSEFMSRMPEPKHIEALHYPTDACLSYAQLLGTVESCVPTTEPYILLAESFSAPLAIQFAGTNPPNLRGLILCAGSLIAPLAFRFPLPKVFVSRYLVGPDAPESLHASVRAAIRSVKPAVFAARFKQVLAVDARLALSRVSVPILYIQALHDRMVGRASLEEIRAIKPQIEVARIDGPHLILQRGPPQAAEAVAVFIRQLASD
jgi:pimeloyl-ACP methyl ester carboxylesterase